MTGGLRIRPARAEDLPALAALYHHLNPGDAPAPAEAGVASLARLENLPGSAVLLGEAGGRLVTSCMLVVIPNLTRGGQPFALIENVVTHAEARQRGHGRALLDAACERAWAAGCYKVMLMTGATRPETLRFYRGAGFEATKTGFQKRRIPARGDG